MPTRARSICRASRCNKLIAKPGYCDDHKELANPFKQLDRKKTPEAKKFYSSYKWTMASKRHRQNNPLCVECLLDGITKIGQLCHHEPPYEELINLGLNPYDGKYLETLCHNHHQGHLRSKRL